MHASFRCILNLIQWEVLGPRKRRRRRKAQRGGGTNRCESNGREHFLRNKKRVLRGGTRVIEVLRSLQGVAVGAALCKALEATRSSPSSIKNTARQDSHDCRCRLFVQSARLFAGKISLGEKKIFFSSFREGRRPFLKSGKTSRKTKKTPRGR